MDIESSWIPSDWIKESAAVTKKPNLQIIGNLPFGVATPITLNLIKHFSSQDKSFFNSFSNVEMILLFQDEVARVPINTIYVSFFFLITHCRNFVLKLEREIMVVWRSCLKPSAT